MMRAARPRAFVLAVSLGLAAVLADREAAADEPKNEGRPCVEATADPPGECVKAGAERAPAARTGAPPASEEIPYVHEGLVYRSTTAVRYNPLGLSSFARVGYQHRLLGDQRNIVLQRTYVGLHALTMVTPTAFWLRDPYRTGRETSQLVPLLAAGLTSAGDL